MSVHFQAAFSEELILCCILTKQGNLSVQTTLEKACSGITYQIPRIEREKNLSSCQGYINKNRNRS